MDPFELLTDLHGDGERQGPGGDEETRLAVDLSGLRGAEGLRIADIGCGTGASTRVIARELDADIVAVDLVQGFLDRLGETVASERVTTLQASMADLPLPEASFDAVWSEGAIYIIGFERGVRAWRRLLKPGGVLAVSELTWLTATRPAELDRHWAEEYPEVATASAKLAVLEANGYTPIGYFALHPRCWLDNYYRPLQARFEAFLDRHDHAQAARDLVEAEQREIELYERFAAYVSYGYYVARRHDD